MVCVMHVRLLVFDWEVLGACAARVGVVVACPVGNGRVACCVGGWEIAGKEGYGLGKGVWNGMCVWVVCGVRACGWLSVAGCLEMVGRLIHCPCLC